MCTVSVLLEAHRNCESILNTRELIVTYLETATHRPISQNSEGRLLTVLNTAYEEMEERKMCLQEA